MSRNYSLGIMGVSAPPSGITQCFETGLFSLMAADQTVTDFTGTDSNGNPEYQLYYIAVFDPPATLPYGIFGRYKRIHEMDIEGIVHQFESSYHMEIIHNSAWLLLNFQQRVRNLLESLAKTVVGGQYIQQIEVEDDYHEALPKIEEVRDRVFRGVLNFTVYHNPTENQ